MTLSKDQARQLALSLTPAERRVAWLLTWGETYEEIAERCDITHGSVRVHVSHIMRKCGCPSTGIPLVMLLGFGLAMPVELLEPSKEKIRIIMENK